MKIEYELEITILEGEEKGRVFTQKRIGQTKTEITEFGYFERLQFEWNFIRPFEKSREYNRIEKSGHWLHKNDDYNDWLECSECGYGSEGEVKFGNETNFCPYCGASMKGVI